MSELWLKFLEVQGWKHRKISRIWLPLRVSASGGQYIRTWYKPTTITSALSKASKSSVRLSGLSWQWQVALESEFKISTARVNKKSWRFQHITITELTFSHPTIYLKLIAYRQWRLPSWPPMQTMVTSLSEFPGKFLLRHLTYRRSVSYCGVTIAGQSWQTPVYCSA